MSITQHILADVEAHYAFLQTQAGEGKLFGSVENDTTNSLLKCYDHDENLVFTITHSLKIFDFYRDSTNYMRYTDSWSAYSNVYETSNGFIAISPANNDAYIITRNNNGNLAWVSPSQDGNNVTARVWSSHRAIAWGDDFTMASGIPSGYRGSAVGVTDYQTVFNVIYTEAPFGKRSYLEKAFMMPRSQTRSVGVFTANEKQFATNGYICLQDD